MPVTSPLTREQHEKQLDDPALCEQLPVRDYLDNVLVRTSGALVAGYELRGITSYFASDEERDRSQGHARRSAQVHSRAEHESPGPL